MKRLLFLSLLIGIAVSCEKEAINAEIQVPNLSSNTCLIQNGTNPHDNVGADFALILKSNYGEYPYNLQGQTAYLNDLQNSIQEWTVKHPTVYGGIVVQKEIDFMKELYVIFKDFQDRQSLFSKIAILETSITNSTLSANQKMRILGHISGIKHFTNYHFEVIDDFGDIGGGNRPIGALESAFVNCITERLGSVFWDDNPVDDIAYILSAPLSFGWDVAYCAWEIFGISILPNNGTTIVSMINKNSNCY